MTDSHLGLCIHVLYDGSSGKSGMLLLMLLLIMVLMRQRVSSLALLEKRVGIVRRAFHNVPGTTIDRYELRNSLGIIRNYWPSKCVATLTSNTNHAVGCNEGKGGHP